MKKSKYKEIPKPKMRIHRESETCVGCTDDIFELERRFLCLVVFISGVSIGVSIGFIIFKI
jgi:hypothetical protein